MRVAVTTIAKNEEAFAERWAESAKDADYRFVLDTGSSDRTVSRLGGLGVDVVSHYYPDFRFDRARNDGLRFIPDDIDYVITLDMDEVLQPGWREALESAPVADQYTYNYYWSEEVFFHGNRCFRRHGFYWKHPVHEVIVPDGFEPKVAFGGFTIVHHPDDTKSRSSYLSLLEMAVKESPNDDRLAHYFARELYFTGNWERARIEFVRHISIASWAPEKAQSYRYLAKMDYEPERWILKAIAETPDRREPWVDLIRLYKKAGLPVDTLISRTLAITKRPVDYMTEAQVWDDELVRDLG